MASRQLHTIRALPARAARPASSQALGARPSLQPGLQLCARARCPPRHGPVQLHAFVRHSSTEQGPAQSSSRPTFRQPTPPTIPDILRKGFNFTAIFSAFGRGGFRKAARQNPGEFLFALVILGGISGVVAYTVYLYFNYFNASQFTRFPKPIAKSLRRALYYTNIKPDPKLAQKYYKRALEQCNELGLDPFSDEVLGIRIQTAAWLEGIGNYNGAITVLGGIVNDCLRWVDVMEKSIADGSMPKDGKVPVPKPTPDQQGTTSSDKPSEKPEDEYIPENLWRKRSRLLAKAVGTSVKLGELNADEHVMQSEESQSRLTWAVETALREFKRRSDEGEKEDEGPWMSASEIGGALESLARNYEKRSQFQLAVPLLFHALRLCEDPCHRPVLMNNLAASFAQHPAGVALSMPAAPSGSPEAAIKTPTTREFYLQSALNWATNAYTHAVDVKGEERTSECDEACAVALCNLGDILALVGKPAEARRNYEECVRMSKSLDFPEGVKQAEAGLDRLNKTTKPS
ncbi:hypothetical protein jhhlp_006178 [Lomentospora prolificans]|uniref:TPR domain-containing protein n=1 Tax=Lomentospora prolificans TaxID=41688 RepID=A0A2N3N583_9PEZI|nr:hypothetical protein jhhlp_006178 [Lomentospora prolificans]